MSSIAFLLIYMCTYIYIYNTINFIDMKKLLKIIKVKIIFLVQQPNAGQGCLILKVSRSHIMTHHIR